MKYSAYPAYSEVDVLQLKHIPKGWHSQRLKFNATYNDEALSEDTASDFEINYVDISSVNLVSGITAIDLLTFEKAPSRARRIVRDGDTIISTVRTYLKAIASIINPPANMIVSTGFAVIRPSITIDRSYLSYCLQSQPFVDSVVANSIGVSYPAINASDLACIPVIFPADKAEQKQIANFLDHKTAQFDQLIKKKKELIEKLNERRIAVITQAVTKGLNPNVKMKDSEVEWLGEVPGHWGLRRIKLLASEPLRYGANETAELTDRDLPRYIRITDVKEDGSLHDDTFRSLEPEIATPFLLNEGDILLARSGATVGKSFIYDKSWGKSAYAGYLIRFRTTISEIDAHFAYFFLRSASYWANINSTLIQSTIQNFSAEKYGNILVPLPPLAEQKEIVKYIKNEKNRIDRMEALAFDAVAKLQEYRTSLITAAVTGKIDVRAFEIPHEAA
jgi:type I restriction enzyme S subunit